MLAKLAYGTLVALFLIVGLLMRPPTGGDPGSIAMVPFSDEESGIRGIAPAGGLSEKAVLLQQSLPGTLAELEGIVLQQTELARMPESYGKFIGRHLVWQLYEFETRVKDAGPWFYRVHMALAKGETRYHNVALLVRPTEYAANKARYQSAFEHALYALEPIE